MPAPQISRQASNTAHKTRQVVLQPSVGPKGGESSCRGTAVLWGRSGQCQPSPTDLRVLIRGPERGCVLPVRAEGPTWWVLWGDKDPPLGFWGPAPGREEASALEFPESRILAGEEPGLCRVAQVDGRAPRRVRSTARNLKKVPSGVPHVSGKAGLAMPSD